MGKQKELVVALAEAEAKMVEAVNSIMQENGLPCFLMEPIIDKIHRQLIEGKTAELAEAKAREESEETENA